MVSLVNVCISLHSTIRSRPSLLGEVITADLLLASCWKWSY